MNKTKLICNNLTELSIIAKKIGNLKLKNIILLKGDMGAGKTTFIKELCRQYGVPDKVTSPSFSIVNEYQTESFNKVYHFDFYRIEDEEEAWDLGTLEYFESGNICLIEWPERIPSLIPDNHTKIEIIKGQQEQRTYIITL